MYVINLNQFTRYISQETALQIALGNINIYNGAKFAHFDPDTFKVYILISFKDRPKFYV